MTANEFEMQRTSIIFLGIPGTLREILVAAENIAKSAQEHITEHTGELEDIDCMDAMGYVSQAREAFNLYVSTVYCPASLLGPSTDWDERYIHICKLRNNAGRWIEEAYKRAMNIIPYSVPECPEL